MTPTIVRQKPATRVGKGHERVRPPRLVLAGAEREAALETIRAALRERPKGV